MPLMKIAICFWTFYNISPDKTDPFCVLFCNRLYSETEEFKTPCIALVKHWSCLHHILSCTYSLMFLFSFISFKERCDRIN